MIGYTNREGVITEGIHINEYGSLKMDEISDLQTRIPYYYNIEDGSDLKKNITKKIKKFYFNDKDVSTDNIDQFLKVSISYILAQCNNREIFFYHTLRI